jgi:hypothetical protein
MSTQTLSTLWSSTSAVNAFQWVNTISAALTALGFVKTTDTGQLDLTGGTVPYPGAFVANTRYVIGYEIRKLALAGKPTIYVRVDYFNHSCFTNATCCYPSMDFTMGSGTDGAGNITTLKNAYICRVQPPSSTNSAASTPNNATSCPIYMASDGASYFTMVVDPAGIAPGGNYTVSPLAFTIERTRDLATGAYDGTGVVLWDVTNGSAAITAGTSIQAYINFTRGMTGSATYLPGENNGNLFTSSQIDGPLKLFPISVQIPDIKRAGIAGFEYYAGEIGNGLTFTATVEGTVRTFMAMGTRCNGRTDATSLNYRLAMRWE